MKAFKDRQRVRVTHPEHPMIDMIGTVVRLRMADRGAWVDMDKDLPGDLRSFPKGDPRQNHTILYPHECEAVLGKKAEA